jgi:hypothetical protein
MYGRAYTIPGDNHYFVRRTVMSENDNVSLHDHTDGGEISSMPKYSDEDEDSKESLHRMAHPLMDRRLGINALMETNEDLVKIKDKNERLDKNRLRDQPQNQLQNRNQPIMTSHRFED